MPDHHLKLRIGTRGSALALRQSEWVAGELRRLHAGLEVQLVIINTRGDRIIDRSLTQVGGKGLFVKEIESALLAGEVDLAVHSLKDVPTDTPPALALAAFPPREDPRDVLVCRRAGSSAPPEKGGGAVRSSLSSSLGLASLPADATVGTSSLRRVAQLKHVRPDLRFVPLRGNVDTRLRKLDEDQADAVVLAGAGLLRLGLTPVITEWLSPDLCVPAAGQGILCVETRQDDAPTRALLDSLDSPVSRACAETERRVVAALQAACEIPLGVLAEVRDCRLHVVAALAEVDGSRVIRVKAEGSVDEPVSAANGVVARLLELGAGEIMARCR